jgi:hypothetical protein
MAWYLFKHREDFALSSCDTKIKIYKTIILPEVLFGVKLGLSH